jgi:hypothetical protein
MESSWKYGTGVLSLLSPSLLCSRVSITRTVYPLPIPDRTHSAYRVYAVRRRLQCRRTSPRRRGREPLVFYLVFVLRALYTSYTLSSVETVLVERDHRIRTRTMSYTCLTLPLSYVTYLELQSPVCLLSRERLETY